jgi:Tol biopolymer transport system component
MVAAVVLVATACYPPSQTPTDQPIPAGGKVVATGPVLTEMWIEDASPDLSTILYGEDDVLINVGDPVPYRFWVYDEKSGTTTSVPVGRAEFGTARLSPDDRSVVFSSDDSRMQVGPTAPNCLYGHGPYLPDTTTYCSELYLFDLDTGVTRQLTGLDGSSTINNDFPTFSADGQSIDFTTTGRGGDDVQVPVPYGYHQLDIATGLITDTTRPAPPAASWDRGSHQVTWDAGTGILTSQDTTTGVVTTLWSNGALYSLVSQADNGRFLVVSTWVTAQREVFDLIDTDTGTVRQVPSQWISQDGSRYAVAQQNVTPDATDRLIIAPVPPA